MSEEQDIAYDREQLPSLESMTAWVRADRDYCEALAVSVASSMGAEG